ncbi:uncharacterized protein TRAVEDRAFT_50241 [Trametes versicolor FP-101664 SS1]|uniref:uncharacterized protein n=1 Tax=Trametes versicolor (strain FP-101664) TaxID=717944 RepID=UPI0004622BD1|nr:uncharacterized protein TRAVEDRAFT_50241 [Trametes versicolor FP-101664 SS1]EIW55761.1 hypothetical protein TRAVEDRAFT_50241 [Trametes versicolor FP-101664 SS1]
MASLTSILEASLSHFDLVLPVKYTAVASLTWVALDVIETFSSEVAYMWPSRLSPIKVLFFVNRYMPFLDMSLATVVALGAKNPRVCAALWPTVVALYWFGSLISEIILIVRTAAVWGYNRAVVAILVLNCIGLVVPSFVMIPTYLIRMTYPPAELLEITACVPSVTDYDCWVFYAGIIVSETTMIVLILLKQYMSASERRISLLLRTTFRDGVGLYTVMLSVSAANMLFMTVAPVEMSSAFQLPHRALHTTLCSRVLLNLREAGANASGCFSHDDYTKHSRMVFATAGAIGTDMSDIPLTTLTQRSYDVHTFDSEP